MVTQEPLPDRCGAVVNDKIGFEVHDEEAGNEYTTSDRLRRVVIERESDGAKEEKEAEFDELISHMKSGFSVTKVFLEPEDGSDELVEVEMEDDDPYTIHDHVEQAGYCERYPMDNGRCYNHGGANTEGHPNNTHAMTHGLRAKRSNYYDSLDDEEKAFIQELIESWIDNAPFDRDNTAKANEVYRIAIDQHRLWNAHDEFKGGFTREQVVGVSDSGEPIEVEEEKPVNLAYDRLDKTNFRKLKDLGCLDDPESQQAEATESLADKFSQLD